MLIEKIKGITAKTSSANIQLDALDGLRGIAVLFVVFSHSSFTGLTPGINFKGAGTIGVYLFFVLSSFLLTLPFVIKDIDVQCYSVWINYSLRRIFRIFPLYLLIIIFYYTASKFGYLPQSASLYFTDLDLIKHIFVLNGKAYLWTIQVETKFYLLLPLLVILTVIFLKKKSSVIFPVILAAVVLISITANNIDGGRNIFSQSPVFLLGFLAALLFASISTTTNKTRALSTKIILDIIAVILLCLSILLIPGINKLVFNNFSSSIFIHSPVFFGALWATCILCTLLSNSFVYKKLSNFLLRYIGIISFSIYIWHVPVLAIIKRLQPDSGWIGFLILLVSVIIISTLSYIYIEKPFLKLRFKL